MLARPPPVPYLRRPPLSRLLLTLPVLALAAPALEAGVLQAGDARLRHEVQLLADSGVIEAPVTGWPIPESDLGDLASPPPSVADAPLLAAIDRLNRRRMAAGAWTFGLGAAGEAPRIRGYGHAPREELETSIAVAAERGRLSVDLELAYADDPSDGREWRADGSRVDLALGNWLLAASAAERWWGPGRDGSLILSNNARPIPALVLQRRRALPFEPRWLAWIGPWTTQLIWGQLEGNRDRGNARYTALRVGLRPHQRLEIGLSRAAQWCGDGRPCGFDTFVELLSGVRDNVGDNTRLEDEPGNQLAGYDLRFRYADRQAFYMQWIGEDEQNGLPSAYTALLGVETWGRLGGNGASFRAHLEYADTACSAITDSEPNLGCAYNHGVYSDGYRYRGRAIGHAIDGDGRLLTLGLLLVEAGDGSWDLRLARGEINRSSRAANSLGALKQDVWYARLTHDRATRFGDLRLGIEHETAEFVSDGDRDRELRVYGEWRYRFGGG